MGWLVGKSSGWLRGSAVRLGLAGHSQGAVWIDRDMETLQVDRGIGALVGSGRELADGWRHLGDGFGSGTGARAPAVWRGVAEV